MPRPAADVAHLEGRAPRQLALKAERELVDVRVDEARIRKAHAAAEKCLQAERRAWGRRDALRKRVRQRKRRRTVAVERCNQRRLHAEAVRRRNADDVEVIQTVAAAHDGLVVQQVCEADARLHVVLVPLIRIFRIAVDVDESEAAAHLIPRELLLVDSRRDRIRRLRVEAVVDPVVLFEHRRVEVPSQAEVQGELIRYFPIVLDPRRVVVPAERRVEVVFDISERRRTQEKRGDRVPAERLRRVEDAL